MALFDHRPLHRLHEIEDAFQVCVQHHVPIFRRHGHAEHVAHHTGIVHQNIDPLEIAQNLFADSLHVGMIGGVNRIRVRRACACGVNLVGCFLRIFLRPPAHATCAPSRVSRTPLRASRTAIAWPIPLPAPVTIAT